MASTHCLVSLAHFLDALLPYYLLKEMEFYHSVTSDLQNLDQSFDLFYSLGIPKS